MGILHVGNHSLFVLALLLGDNTEEARIWDGDALKVAMFA
jgi:hypothetical protein